MAQFDEMIKSCQALFYYWNSCVFTLVLFKKLINSTNYFLTV